MCLSDCMVWLRWPHAWGKRVNTLVLLTKAPLSSKSHRLQEKRQSLMEKLLPRSGLVLQGDTALLLTKEKGKKNSCTKAQQPLYKSGLPVKEQQSDSGREEVVDTVKEAEEHTPSASACCAPGSPATGEKLFVFRDPPESCNSVDVPNRKRKRNFLNLKKGSVAPTNLPWNLSCLLYYFF